MTTKPVTDAEVYKAIRQLDMPMTTVSDMLVRCALESFAAQREQGVEAVGAVPVIGIFHERANPPQEDWIEWPDGYEPVDGMKIYTAPPSSKTHDDPWALTRDLVGVNINPANMMTTSELPKAPAPVLVVQGEPDPDWLAQRHTAIKNHHTYEFKDGELTLHADCIRDAPRQGFRKGVANMAVGAVGGVGAIDKAHLPDLRYIRMFLLGLGDKKHRSGDLSAAINGINYIISRTESATPAHEQATTGSGQGVTDAKDARRYRFLKDKCGFGVRRNGVVELTICFSEAEPAHIKELDMFLDAAILSTASPAGEGGVKS